MAKTSIGAVRMFLVDVRDSFSCSEEGNYPPGFHSRRGEPRECWSCYARWALTELRKSRRRSRGTAETKRGTR